MLSLCLSRACLGKFIHYERHDKRVWEKKTVSVPVARLRLEELVARVPDIDRLTGLLVLIVCKRDERDEPVCVCV
eukprot:COSAG06_NODE_2882_length_6137_cov_32.350613_2_plen_75_part_00